MLHVRLAQKKVTAARPLNILQRVVFAAIRVTANLAQQSVTRYEKAFFAKCAAVARWNPGGSAREIAHVIHPVSRTDRLLPSGDANPGRARRAHHADRRLSRRGRGGGGSCRNNGAGERGAGAPGGSPSTGAAA